MSAGGTVQVIRIGRGQEPSGPHLINEEAWANTREMLRQAWLSNKLTFATRGWMDIVSQSAQKEVPKIADTEPEGFDEFGGPSDFTTQDFRTQGGGVQVKTKDDDDKPPSDVNYSETERSEKETVYTNPGDATQTVTFQEATRIKFNPPDQEHEIFVMILHPGG